MILANDAKDIDVLPIFSPFQAFAYYKYKSLINSFEF